LTVADLIELRGLRVMALCGVLPEEQVRKQPFELDVSIETDLRAAGVSDDLADTIDYGALVEGIGEIADGARFALLERFAHDVAELALGHPEATAVTVTIRKLRPPVARDLASSGVSIRRLRE
jgi:FolB domain-containing protein